MDVCERVNSSERRLFIEQIATVVALGCGRKVDAMWHVKQSFLQGSVLGPVLFLLYINDMHRSSDQLHFASDSDINNVHASVNRELVGVDNWLKTDRLSLNVSKTSYMIISNQKSALDINIRETILTKVSTVKFLGVTLLEIEDGSR